MQVPTGFSFFSFFLKVESYLYWSLDMEYLLGLQTGAGDCAVGLEGGWGVLLSQHQLPD